MGANASMIVGLICSLYNLVVSFGVNLPTFWEAQSATQVVIGVSLSTFCYILFSYIGKSDKGKAEKFIELAGK